MIHVYLRVIAYWLFVKAASPSCTELEIVMMDWLGKLLQLPDAFLSGGKGSGVIQVQRATRIYIITIIMKL